MAGKKKKTTASKSKRKPDMDALKQFVRQNAKHFLAKPNINSVGIGYKISGGKRTDQISIQFTVDKKVGLEALEALDEAFRAIEAAGCDCD